jgi:outer membrane lipoprotein-sorting protein
MNSPENIEKLIKNAVIHSNPDMNQAVLKELLQQFDDAREQKPAVTQPKIRRTIMKSPITKLAAAAVIIVLVVLGLFEFIGTESTSGVVWAEVAQKVQASRGSASRITTSSPGNPENCTLSRRSPTGYRADMYAGDVLKRTICVDLEAKTKLLLAHDAKVWFREELSEQDEQTIRDEWMTPENYAKRFLSGGYRELGQRRIEGVLCEGVEVTDAAVFEVNGPARGELWVSVETGYPVLVRVEMTGGEDGQQRQVVTVDQIRWDAEYDESEFEVEIPPDYEQML